MYPEGRPEGALPLLGMRGRLGSEQGPVGGGCCGRVDAACDEWGGWADPADGWKGLVFFFLPVPCALEAQTVINPLVEIVHSHA